MPFGFIIHNVYTPTAYKTNNRLWYIAEKHEIHSFIFCYINNNFFNPARVKYNPNKIIFKVHNQFTHSLYKKTYWKINRMKIQYFAERGSAEIINTIGMDIDNVSSVVDQITQFSISSILQIIGGVVGLSLLDWKLAILIEAIIPLKFIIVSYCANKKREVFEQWIEDKRKFMSWFAECINGIHEMKLWNCFR